MAASFQAVLRDKNKKGQYHLKIKIYHNKESQYVSTGNFIAKNQLTDKGEVVRHPDAISINRLTQKLISLYREYYADLGPDADTLNCLDLKNTLNDMISGGKEKGVRSPDLIAELDMFIGALDEKYKAELIYNPSASCSDRDNFKSLGVKLRDFAGNKLYFSQIDEDWLMKFENHLRTNGLNGGIMSVMSRFRKLYNHVRTARKILIEKNVFEFYKVSDLKIKTLPDTIEYETLYRFFANKPRNMFELRAWQVFKLNFYLQGVNPKDIYAINYGGGKITNGRFVFYRGKTKEPHMIKLEPEALELIEELRGEKTFFEFQERFSNVGNFRYLTNTYLERHSTRLELPEKLTLNNVRYMWSTIGFNECEVSLDLIDLGLAHGSDKKSLAKAHYIKMMYDRLDEANRRIIDHVNAEVEKYKIKKEAV